MINATIATMSAPGAHGRSVDRPWTCPGKRMRVAFACISVGILAALFHVSVDVPMATRLVEQPAATECAGLPSGRPCQRHLLRQKPRSPVLLDLKRI